VTIGIDAGSYAAALGRKLKELRIASGRSQRDVAEATKGAVSAAQLEGIEQGAVAPSVRVLQALARAHGIVVDDLLPADTLAIAGIFSDGSVATVGAIPPAYVDATTGLRVEAHEPGGRPDRWAAYVEGATSAYRAAAVASALAGVSEPSLFFVAVDANDRVVAGVRCHGPLASPEHAALLDELAEHAQVGELRDLLADLVPEGLLEIKGAWAERSHQLRGLGHAIGRCCTHAMTWFGAGHAVGSSSRQLARLWRTTGWRPYEPIEAFP
jgi:hypothetical protein